MKVGLGLLPRKFDAVFRNNLISYRAIMAASVLAFALSQGSALALTPTVTTLTVSSAGSPVTTVASPAVVTLTATTAASGTPVTQGVINFCYSTQLSCTGAALVGAAQLTASGSASISFHPAIGSHSYVAVFQGNATGQASTSAVSALSVTQGAAPLLPTSTTIAQTGTSAGYTLSGTVTADGVAAPTGPMNFVDLTNGSNILASPALANPVQSTGFLTVPATTMFANATPLVDGDFNGDGIPDLIAVLSDNSVVCQLGKGDGSFATASTLQGSASVAAIGDFNSDGKLDVALGSGTGITIFLGDGTGNFSAAPSGTSITVSAQNLSVVDFNQDGILDLAVTDAGSAYVYLGVGDGTFTAGYTTPITTLNGQQGFINNTAIGDFNADGTTDVAVAWTSPQVSILDTAFYITFLFGNGAGGFTPSTVNIPADFGTGTFGPDPLAAAPPEGFVIVANDLNKDGKVDIQGALSYIGCCPGAQVTGGVSLLNNGDSTFTTTNYLLSFYLGGPIAAATLDVTGDGTTTTATRWNPGSVGPLEAGTPDPAEIILYGPLTMPSTAGSGFVVGDFNGDGIQDIAIGGAITTSIAGYQTTSTASATGVVVSPAGTGTHQVEASYPGDTAHLPSISATVSLATPLATPTITLSSLPSVAYGLPLTITATLISGGTTPTGTVTFLNGAATLGTAPLTNGIAALTLSNLAPGNYSVNATYPGDVNDLPATSSAIAITVTTQTPTLTLTTPTPSTTYGSSISLTATMTVQGTLPSATITFKNQATVLGTVPLDANGVATLNIPSPGLPTGTDSVTASFAGNTDFSTIVSSPVMIIVSKATLAVVLTPSPSAISVGSSDTLVLALPAAGSTATGTATFNLGTATLGSGAVSNGSASLTTAVLPAGMDSITATYSGDANFNTATSPAAVVMVSPSLTLTSSAPTIYSGVPDTIQVTFGLGGSTFIPTGTVTLTSGNYTSSPATLSAGAASLTIPANSLPVGSDAVVASYSGDSNFPAATGSIVLAVSSLPAPGFTITAPALTIAPGATTGDTVQVTLTPVTGFTGTVTLAASVTSSPANATDVPTISFGANSSVDITGNSAVTATLTVSTIAPATARNDARGFHDRGQWLIPGGTALGCAFLLCIPGRRRRGLLRTMRNLTLLLTLMGTLLWWPIGCGSSGPTKLTNPGTTPGTYTITVTGTSGAVSKAGTVTVTVQ